MKYAQNFFTNCLQLMPIHGQQFPLVYGLLPRKTRETYNRFFSVRKIRSFKFGLQISPDEVMSDFELPLAQLLELQFPGAHIHECYFLSDHFSQCLWIEKGPESWSSRGV